MELPLLLQRIAWFSEKRTVFNQYLIPVVRLFKKKEFFKDAENQQIVQAIREAERMTSGEIRVFVEHHCRFVDSMDRASEIFEKLQMHRTKARNGVLIYVAMRDKQFAILGDQGIHLKVGTGFWDAQAAIMRRHFSTAHFVEGISACARSIGEVLQQYFPYESDDENELPDDIVFGK